MTDEDLIEKYKARLRAEFGHEPVASSSRQFSSQDYEKFRKSYLPKNLGLYEKACNLSARFFKLKPDPKTAEKIKKNLETCHLQATPQGVVSLSFLAPIAVAFFGILISFALLRSLVFVFFFLLLGLLMYFALARYPKFAATSWRLKASNQMVQSVFYVVTYMRHTSNLERAIGFAADHLAPPLSLDFKKILWNVETGKFDKIKDSLENYLEDWKETNMEFVESVNLVEGSLYEASESRRLDALDKALTTILQETYEKMLHYAHNLQGPMTMLHMIGVIMPILGLVILPLVVSFLTSDELTPGFIALVIGLLYNVSLPLAVYYYGKIILAKRPTGYGDSDISEENPELKKFKKFIIHLGKKEVLISPLYISLFIGVILFIIGLSPLWLHVLDPGFDIYFFDGALSLIGYICPGGLTCEVADRIGPYGLGAAILSLFVIAAVGVSTGIYYRLRSKNVIKIREKTNKLEQEFASALFQLGNRLGDGLPAEIAVGKVAQIMQGTTSGSFFDVVSQNITRNGMSLEQAIFHKKVGALVYFPSKVIESAMKMLLESIKKGPYIAAQSLISVSRYIKEIHSVNERLKDLLADIISSMKSQIKFLTPAIAGIVVGITSMITTILNTLGSQIGALAGEEGAGVAGVMSLFGNGVPTYYFQIIVGLYVVQIIYILVVLSNAVENGSDILRERYELGQNLVNSTLLYCGIALAVMLIFNIIAANILGSTLI